MKKTLQKSFAIILVFSLIIHSINKFLLPFLPQKINTDIILWLLVITNIAAFLASISDVTNFFQNLEDNKNRDFLNDTFKNGPFDEATIERSTQYYIRPKCSNVDPAQEVEPRHALMATSQPLFELVNDFITKDQTNRHLFILADSGTGKTSFILNYFAYNSRRRKNKAEIVLIPLNINNADELIQSVTNKKYKVIFLDSFDEDIKAISNHKDRIHQLMQLCKDFKKVIITCRTQFFPSEEEIPTETGILRIGQRIMGVKKNYEFWKLYLSPFTDDDIRDYLNKRYPFGKKKEREKAKEIISKVELLAVRPMLLTYIPALIEKYQNINYSHEIYAIMINAWLEMESLKSADKYKLRVFSTKLALDLYINKHKRGMERVSKEELRMLATQWDTRIPQWKLTGRSLLNRDAVGNLKFAHRSIMEYIFALQLSIGNPMCFCINLTDQMRFFFFEIIEKELIHHPDSHIVKKTFKNINAFVQNKDFSVEFLDFDGHKLKRDYSIEKINSIYNGNQFIKDVRKYKNITNAIKLYFTYLFLDGDLSLFTENKHEIIAPVEELHYSDEDEHFSVNLRYKKICNHLIKICNEINQRINRSYQNYQKYTLLDDVNTDLSLFDFEIGKTISRITRFDLDLDQIIERVSVTDRRVIENIIKTSITMIYNNKHFKEFYLLALHYIQKNDIADFVKLCEINIYYPTINLIPILPEPTKYLLQLSPELSSQLSIINRK